MPDVIPWGEWRPDVSVYRGQHSPTITNVVPQGDGYGPVKDLGALTSALASTCLGFFTALDDDGTVAIFAGTSTKLYKLNNSDYTWDDVSISDTTALDVSGGSNIGDLTSGGGLAAAFDSTTAQAAAACANVASATTAYVGVTLATSANIHSVKVYGSNDAGYVSSINPDVTLTVYGKTGTAPSNGTDGTVIATLAAFTDTADESTAKTLTSTDLSTYWDHVWVYLSHDGAANQINVAEVEFYSSDSYSVGAGDLWSFTQLNTTVMAVNGTSNTQSFVLGSSSVFADLGGSPPVGTYITTVSQYAVESGLSANPFQIQWCSTSDPTEWTAGTNGGDTQTFTYGGVVRGIAGGEYGLVFQDYAIRRMTYAPGSSLYFEFDIISDGVGLLAPYSLVEAKDMVFFLSNVGFQMWNPSSGFTPIGRERVDRFFFKDWDDGDKRLMQGVMDPNSTRVLWLYKSVQGAPNLFDRAIVYDYVLDRWSGFVSVTGAAAGIVGIPSITLENLDNINSSIDALTTSLDDYGGVISLQLAIADDSNIIGLFNGSTKEATIETADIVGEKRAFIRGQRPVSDAPTIYGSVSTLRQTPYEAATFGTESLLNSIGYCPHREDSRLVRFRNRIPAGTDWTYSMGIEPDFTPSGSY